MITTLNINLFLNKYIENMHNAGSYICDQHTTKSQTTYPYPYYETNSDTFFAFAIYFDSFFYLQMDVVIIVYEHRKFKLRRCLLVSSDKKKTIKY